MWQKNHGNWASQNHKCIYFPRNGAITREFPPDIEFNNLLKFTLSQSANLEHDPGTQEKEHLTRLSLSALFA